MKKKIMPFMYCDPPASIIHIRPATNQSHAGSGIVKLSSGTTFEITTPYPESPDSDFLIKLRKSDHIQICYAPPQKWADAGPDARMAIVGDVESGAYMYVLSYPKVVRQLR